MANILMTGTKSEQIAELKREVNVARAALARILDVVYWGDDEHMGLPIPEVNGKVQIIGRDALAEMEDSD
jgi:hypothetical protein